jgi:hypothetical protein
MTVNVPAVSYGEDGCAEIEGGGGIATGLWEWERLIAN